MEKIGKLSNLRAPWRWDDQARSLVRDQDSTNEKQDSNAKIASKKIDRWGFEDADRPTAYVHSKIDVSKDQDKAKRPTTISDVVHEALGMVDTKYFLPDYFADFVQTPELEDFFLHVINYFHWFFEHIAAQEKTNPLLVEYDYQQRQRIAHAQASMNTALLLVAQKYTNIVLGTGLKQFHHFYWIEGIEGDPLTKRREIIPYFGLVSRTAIDRGFGESLIMLVVYVVYRAFDRKHLALIRVEVGRILRTEAFQTSKNKIRTRSTKSAAPQVINNVNEQNLVGAQSDRKQTGENRKTAKSRGTVTTAMTNASTSSKSSQNFQSKTTPVHRLLTQRSPILVTLLPTARDQNAWLFSRRHSAKNGPPEKKMIPEKDFQILHHVGLLGQPFSLLVPESIKKNSSGDTSALQTESGDHSSIER